MATRRVVKRSFNDVFQKKQKRSFKISSTGWIIILLIANLLLEIYPYVEGFINAE